MVKQVLKKIIPSPIIRLVVNCYLKRRYQVKFGKGVRTDFDTKFEGRNLINDYTAISRSYIGLGSYVAGHTSLTRVKIGRFCSIGQNVKNSLGIHPTEYISTHPAFFSKKKQAGFSFVKESIFEEHKYVDSKKQYLAIIGNDVWIGNNVILMDGITIGDGAIIGTGAIVTKDVDPYCIVGGIPAKLIRKRFDDTTIRELIDLSWWNKGFDWIEGNAALFTDPIEFIESHIGVEL